MKARERALAALALVALVGLAPTAVSGQLGIAARVGTLGLGGEGSIAFSDRFVLRGGAGFWKVETGTSFNGVPVTLELPDAWYNVGIDFYLNSALRIGGGVVFKPDDPTIRGDLTGPVTIGGVELTPSEIGALTGVVDMDGQAAYALFGFGKHTDSGVGLFIDVGAAIFGSPRVLLSAEGGTYPQAELDQLLAEEARNFEDDMKAYLRIWPILSIGLRIGIDY
jgi:hypothetical protein